MVVILLKRPEAFIEIIEIVKVNLLVMLLYEVLPYKRLLVRYLIYGHGEDLKSHC